MTNMIPSVVGETSTVGVVTTTIVELEIPTGFFGSVFVDVTATDEADPANAYAFQNTYLVSEDAGACTIRDDTAIPLELDPGATGLATVVNTNGQNFRVQGTGVIGNFIWVAHVSGLAHER